MRYRMRSFRPVVATTFSAAMGVLWIGLVPSSPAAGVTPACGATTCQLSYAVTGTPQAFTVPAGVTSVTVTLAAGSGGQAQAGGRLLSAAGGTGGVLSATVPVIPGHVLTLVVGQRGQNAPTGPQPVVAVVRGGYGGGGNAADVEIGTQGSGGGAGGGGSFLFDTTSNKLLAAAGGGGGSCGCTAAGNGGSTGPGTAGVSTLVPHESGAGGTQTTGGVGGGNIVTGGTGTGPATSPAQLGTGGGSPGDSGPGGGGGGFYGGGAGGDTTIIPPKALPRVALGSGGGGAGFLTPAATLLTTSSNTGDGYIRLAYKPSATPGTSTTTTTTTTPTATHPPTATQPPTPAAAGVSLPNTGGNPGVPATLAAVLIATGTGLLAATRKQRTH